MSLESLLLWQLAFFVIGLALGLARPWLSRRRDIAIDAQPLPCVLFRRGMRTEEQVVWLRWMADKLEAQQAQEEGGDDPR